MKRYLAMLGMVTLLALPAVVGAEVKLKPGSEEFFLLYGTTQLTESLTKEGVITEQELTEVPAPVTTAPATGKTDQPSPGFRWAGVEGAVY